MHLLRRILRHILYRVLLMKHTTGLRVTKEEEEKGLNIVEFSDIYSWQNYIETSSYEQEIQEKMIFSASRPGFWPLPKSRKKRDWPRISTMV